VDCLHELGVRVAMMTGDGQAVADSVAKRLDIDHVKAQVLPADKAAAVAAFQASGRGVAIVGDGVTMPRRSPIGAGTDVAVESAGIALVLDGPRDVVGAITVSRASHRKMVQNLAWAAGYNVVAIPVGAGRRGASTCRWRWRGGDEPVHDHRGCQGAAASAAPDPTSGAIVLHRHDSR
jgi:Cu2+-exporting ATPase